MPSKLLDPVNETFNDLQSIFWVLHQKKQMVHEIVTEELKSNQNVAYWTGPGNKPDRGNKKMSDLERSKLDGIEA